MVDKNALKAEWVRKGMTKAEVTKAIGMSDPTFDRRLRKGVFGSDEIEKLISVLEIKNPMDIFFASK